MIGLLRVADMTELELDASGGETLTPRYLMTQIAHEA